MPMVEVSNGGTTPLTLTLHTYADRFSEHGGVLTIPASHGFKTLTVDAYVGSSSYSESPKIRVASSEYNRPAVGTVINIENKEFVINTYDTATWTSVGITVTLT